MNKDIMTTSFTGEVDSELSEGKKHAAFDCIADLPGGPLRVLVRVAQHDEFHLVLPKGTRIVIIQGEIYRDSRVKSDKKYDMAVYVRDSSHIVPSAKYLGECTPEELLQEEERA